MCLMITTIGKSQQKIITKGKTHNMKFCEKWSEFLIAKKYAILNFLAKNGFILFFLFSIFQKK